MQAEGFQHSACGSVRFICCCLQDEAFMLQACLEAELIFAVSEECASAVPSSSNPSGCELEHCVSHATSAAGLEWPFSLFLSLFKGIFLVLVLVCLKYVRFYRERRWSLAIPVTALGRGSSRALEWVLLLRIFPRPQSNLYPKFLTVIPAKLLHPILSLNISLRLSDPQRIRHPDLHKSALIIQSAK